MATVSKVAVLGGGSFGTVIANLVAEKGIPAHLWVRTPETADAINQSRVNSRYVPKLTLADSLLASSDIESVLSGAEVVFIAIPSSSFRSVLKQAKPFLNDSQLLISTTKGIEAGTFQLMSQVMTQEAPNNPNGVISGPNLAKEIANRELTATVIASAHEQVQSLVQTLLQSTYFRVYASSDTFGVELGGTLKNIYAIASGMGAAMGMGENTKAMLVTRSLAEMSRLAVSMGANPMTFLGLAGVGDLIVTCLSPLSRNYRVGYALGQGKSLEEAVAELGEVAEGVNTLKLVREHSDQQDVYMPLVRGLYEVVFNQAPLEKVIGQMMGAVQNADVEFTLAK
ncbi:NAD(P)H-dependent glycerol-3-phosphate dehydrogenase [Marinobacterium sp. LSUCC0821]|jgi:glycerol-3-phosphate dehydrogenase (NAD(P)+)|uniref:NAD(P)H-dependent glycerol-3-phosphate dehydrogenase n=1 Tax=Marinobacterium sp. LSUCC0821 TaxID=2668067 RepID=UPI001451AE41|nr:NAD(P)H-dependent glycerol-3-phosphate dehydrogenase [Marinobacterium sp. LSUCC0821]QJD70972.1 NAD(P)H-dependent glycerol-3-phosphate dehydrogenase [Marinobacterium sp. LSUCC0821]